MPSAGAAISRRQESSGSSHAVTPLQQRGAKLVGIGEIHRGEFGRSIVLSADGKTAAVGGSNDNSPTFDSKRGVLSLGLGAVWVFKRTGSTWKQQGPKIVGQGESGPGQFGAAIALSGDGKELMVGAPADRAGQGAAWVYVWTGKTWRQQGQDADGDHAGSFRLRKQRRPLTDGHDGARRGRLQPHGARERMGVHADG